MPSEWDESFADARDEQFHVFGQAETYTFADGSGSKAVTIITGIEASELLELDESRQTYRHLPVQIQRSDVERPKRGDTVTVTNDDASVETWTVHAIEAIVAGYSVARVVIPVRVPYEGRKMQR